MMNNTVFAIWYVQYHDKQNQTSFLQSGSVYHDIRCPLFKEK